MQPVLDPLPAALCRYLARVRLRPAALRLDTGNVRATVPMLRGVWGAALRRTSPAAYTAVFEGGDGPAHLRAPLYLMRPFPPDPEFNPAVSWILLQDACDMAGPLDDAWHLAAACGLGPERIPFAITRVAGIRPDGSLDRNTPEWTLDLAAGPAAFRDRPARIRFDAPLRFLRDNRLVAEPSFADIAVMAHRRIAALLSPEDRSAWDALRVAVANAAWAVPAESGPWESLDLVRYSGTQKAQLQYRGRVGSVLLPRGLGPVEPLVHAAQWIHLGKGTIFGMGAFNIEPADEE